MVEQSFDVFLAHSSQDKPLIRQLYRKLKERGIKPWLDEEEIAPGTSFQDEIQQAIARIKTAAICIGQGGLGKWQTHELKALISQCVERSIPVIPVLLPGVEKIPENLLFLREFNTVVFSQELEDKQALDRLEWGIKGKKPQHPIYDPVHPVVQASELTQVSTPTPLLVTPSTTDDDLSSERLGQNYYARLRDFLKAGQWREADQDTADSMCEVMTRQQDRFLSNQDIQNFPCHDLRNIDHLWLKYSNGKFGFSVQKKVYLDCGGKLDGKEPNDKVWEKFSDSVGWRLRGQWISYNKLTFSTQVCEGHLPIMWAVDREMWFFWVWIPFKLGLYPEKLGCLFSRAQTCKL